MGCIAMAIMRTTKMAAKTRLSRPTHQTEPPNTNSFFGQGGYAVWASDNTTRKVRGCITVASGLGSDVSKCLDMTFE